jgi:AcrR family transcriptional regulator
LRSETLSAARKLIKEEGYQRLTIRKLAQRLECSPMALYSYFANKQALLNVLATEGFEEADKRFESTGRHNPLSELKKIPSVATGLQNLSEYDTVPYKQDLDSSLKNLQPRKPKGHLTELMTTSDSTIKEVVPPAAERIVRTARELFFAHGFSAVTIDQLCKEASVSKSSLYKYFGDMSGVLSAVVRAHGDVIYERVIPELSTANQYWLFLVEHGSSLLKLLNRRDTIELDRMVHEQARKYPATSRAFYDAAYGRTHQHLTEMIQFGKQKGFITKWQVSDQLADNLLCIWLGLASVRSRLSLNDDPFPDPETRAREGVNALFEVDSLLT